MEPRIQYAKTKDGVSIAVWTLGEGRPLVFMPTLPFSNAQLEWNDPVCAASSGHWLTGSESSGTTLEVAGSHSATSMTIRWKPTCWTLTLWLTACASNHSRSTGSFFRRRWRSHTRPAIQNVSLTYSCRVQLQRCQA